MCFLKTIRSEVQINQLDLFVFRVLQDHELPASLVAQSQLHAVLTLAGSAVLQHADETIGEVFEVQIELVFGLEGFEAAVAQTNNR